MSVIARKIAHAAQSPVDRPDPDSLADSIEADLIRLMCSFLGLDELDRATVTGRWAVMDYQDPDARSLTRRVVSAPDRAIFTLPEPVCRLALSHLLRIDLPSDADSLEALHPFLDEAILGLAAPLDGLALFSTPSTGLDAWERIPTDELIDALEDQELFIATLTFTLPDGETAAVELALTPGCIITADGGETTAQAPRTPPRPPRLGPCHVEIQAIADRIRMSVADCSRLELGQVVALPGLRFDHLELRVDMEGGPVPLVDAALGAEKGFKAVRLNRALDPEFRLPPDGDLRAASRTTQPGRSHRADTVHA